VNVAVNGIHSESFVSASNVSETEAVSAELVGGWNGDRVAGSLGVELLESDRGWKDPP